MPDRLTFQADDQSEIAKAALKLFWDIENQLPRVPWFSNSGQQNAFRQIVRLVIDAAEQLDAEHDAKKAVVFFDIYNSSGQQACLPISYC